MFWKHELLEEWFYYYYFFKKLIIIPIFSKHLSLSQSFQILHHFQIHIQKINYVYYLSFKKEIHIYLFICLKKKNHLLLSNIDIKITFKKKKISHSSFFFLIISFMWFQNSLTWRVMIGKCVMMSPYGTHLYHSQLVTWVNYSTSCIIFYGTSITLFFPLSLWAFLFSI